MKYYELTKEEQELLEAVENGEFASVENLEEEKRKAIQIAQNTLNKTKNINIRLSEKVLHKVKVKAAEEGIPYQTLIASIIHKYAA